MIFSLLTEPWIPLIRTDGTTAKGSLSDALLEPDQWAGIDCTNPVECLALHRLLLAICHRAVGPGDTRQRAALFDAWPKLAISSYLEQWSDRFNLFDPERPFLQTPELADTDLTPRPWMVLAPDRASGATPVFWDHSLDAEPEPIGAATATLALIAHQQFTPGGLVRALRTSGHRGTACGLLLLIPIGQTLLQTLALALVPQTKADHQLDLPAWEQAPPSLDVLRKPNAYVPAGPAQRYTHISRAILFEPGSAITHLLYGEGLVVEDSPIPDPMAAVIAGSNGPRPLSLSESRGMWRDFHALAGAQGASPPMTIQNAASICELSCSFDPINLLAGGLLTDKAKILFWRLEQRQVAPALLAQGNAVSVAQTAVDRAEKTGHELNKAIWSLCFNWLAHSNSGPDPDKQAVSSLRNSLHAMPEFWGALEPAFWSLIHQLGEGMDQDEALTNWSSTLQTAVRAVWTRSCDAMGRDGRALAATARAGQAFRKALTAAA